MKEIRPRSCLDATLSMPGSKSITHRALVAAGLAEGESVLDGALFCEDTRYTITGLQQLGIPISSSGNMIKVAGLGGEFYPSNGIKRIYLGNAGTSYRLLLSIVSLASGRYILTGSSRMRQRPIGELVAALNKLGVQVSCPDHEGFPPVSVKAGGIRGGNIKIKGDISSQYVSSLLLAGPYAKNGIEIEVKKKPVSGPYVDVTIDVMRRFGVAVERNHQRRYKIEPGQRYQPCSFKIDGDLTNASYFWAAAAVTGGTVTTENIYPLATEQGDKGFLRILEDMGCRVRRERDRVTVSGETLSGIDVDMAAMPDMVPTLAAIALFAKGRTAIRNISHLRLKESDRIRAIASEWSRLGSRVTERDDGIIIYGGEALSEAIVDPHNDHRLAMSLAVVGLRVPGIRVKNERCVNKSFPGFWELWDSL